MKTNKYSHCSIKGFSLVELAVVLVVIGLIVATILAGKGAIFNAKIRSQVSDLANYSSGFNAFSSQYGAVPGDMYNASSFWSGANDGNGDGKINYSQDAANSNVETRSFFEHLSKAGLIEGKYDGTWAIGKGYPALKINPHKGMVAAWGIDQGTPGSAFQLTDAQALVKYKVGIYLNVSRPSAGGSGYNDNEGTLNPNEAQAIDAKIDDGLARQGQFRGYTAWGSSFGNCLAGTSSDTYLVSNTLDACAAEFILRR